MATATAKNGDGACTSASALSDGYCDNEPMLSFSKKQQNQQSAGGDDEHSW